MQAITVSSFKDSKIFYGSLRLTLVVINEFLKSVEELDLKNTFMRLYLKSIQFLEESKKKFFELTDFYFDDANDISFGENNMVFYPINFLRLFNKKSEQELMIFAQKNLTDEIFTQRVYVLRELYEAKQSFNSFMFELLEDLSEQAKEKIALSLGQEGIDVVNVKMDAMFIKQQFQDKFGGNVVDKHLSVEELKNFNQVDLQGEEMIYALLQTEANVRLTIYFINTIV
jgi:hypothetical protein